MTFHFPEDILELVGILTPPDRPVDMAVHIEKRKMTVNFRSCEQAVGLHILYRNNPSKYSTALFGDDSDVSYDHDYDYDYDYDYHDDHDYEGKPGLRSVRLGVPGAASTYLPISPMNSVDTLFTTIRMEKSSSKSFRGTKTDYYAIRVSDIKDYQHFFDDGSSGTNGKFLVDQLLYRTADIIDESWKTKCAYHAEMRGYDAERSKKTCDSSTITLNTSYFKPEYYTPSLSSDGVKTYHPTWEVMTSYCKSDTSPTKCDYQVFGFWLEKSSKRVLVTEETDPVNGWEIPGVIAGYLGYVAVIFNLFFRLDPKVEETRATKLTRWISRKFLGTTDSVQPVDKSDNIIEDGRTAHKISVISA